MLKLFESTPGTPVMSLRTGGSVAVVKSAVINPNNLFIEAWVVEDNRSGEELIMLSSDVREVLPQGFAINDHEDLSTSSELVRLKDHLEMRFELLGLKVNSESGRRYGKITDYAFETSSMYIQKLYASQSVVRSFNGGSLSIDRVQIIEVTNRRVVIEDPVERAASAATSPGIAG